jgi:thioredoxin reductase
VARALIVATGARPRMLNVPGELSLLGLGVSYSAISHAPLFWGKDTAVVGSDDLAFRAVTELATLANRVYLVSKEPLPQPSPWMDKILSLDNVTVLENTAVTAVGGSPYLEQITVRTPNGREQELPVRGLFVELGLIPNTEVVQGLVELDHHGRIIVNSRGQTSRPGLYAAGDVTNGYAEQVLIAVGDGAKAVLSAYEYLLRRAAPLRTGITRKA